MNAILNYDEFSSEISKYQSGERVDEGLLQFLKSMFRQDWGEIQSDSKALKDGLEKIDRKLDGYTMMKRSNFDACHKFRQALCDFANQLLEVKLGELEGGKELKKVVMGIASDEDKLKAKMKSSSEIINTDAIKDKAMREKLQDAESEVDSIIKKYGVISAWAKAMKRGVKSLINDIIIAKSEADDKEVIQQALDKQKKEDEELLKQINNDAQKEQQELIKELEKFRKDTIIKLGATSFEGADGTTAINRLTDEFAKVITEIKNDSGKLLESVSTPKIDRIMDIVSKNDDYFAINKVIELIKNNYKKASERKDYTKAYFNICSVLFEKVKKENTKRVFKEVPSNAIQAMLIGLSFTVGYGLLNEGNRNKLMTDDVLDLITRCCISKDATIGYSFPLVDEKKPDKGTIFQFLVVSLSKFTNGGDVDKAFDTLDATVKTNFKNNIKNLIKKILDNAEDIKTKAEEERQKKLEELKKKMNK